MQKAQNKMKQYGLKYMGTYGKKMYLLFVLEHTRRIYFKTRSDIF